MPAFIDVSGSEFSARPSLMLAEVAAGGVIRITDRRMGRVRGYLTAELPAGLKPVADLLPPPVLEDGSPVPRPGEKLCSACRKVKPATTDEFYRDRTQPDGLYGRCKKCKRAGIRKLRQARATGSETGH